jgi:hypothetical protein
MYLVRKLERFHCGEQKLRSSPRPFPYLNHVNYNLNETSMRLTPKKFLVLCPNYGGDECLRFSIRNQERKKVTQYNHCVENSKKVQQRAKKKRSNT